MNGIRRSEYVKQVMSNEELRGPWYNVDPTRTNASGDVSMSFAVEADIGHVWKGKSHTSVNVHYTLLDW